MSGMLASINSLDEALQIQHLGIDIIDLKQPAKGALGALALTEVQTIVDHLGHINTLSATIGDLPMEPDRVQHAVLSMAASGVDYIKIGFFSAGDTLATLNRLKSDIEQNNLRLIAVLFADQQPDFSLIPRLAETGFSGVMLDTADKQNGSLLDVMPLKRIEQFVQHAKQHRLLTGLAGSLRQTHIHQLLPFQADYLGFRGALCHSHLRTQALDLSRVQHIQHYFNAEKNVLTEPA